MTWRDIGWDPLSIWYLNAGDAKQSCYDRLMVFQGASGGQCQKQINWMVYYCTQTILQIRRGYPCILICTRTYIMYGIDVHYITMILIVHAACCDHVPGCMCDCVQPGCHNHVPGCMCDCVHALHDSIVTQWKQSTDTFKPHRSGWGYNAMPWDQSLPRWSRPTGIKPKWGSPLHQVWLTFVYTYVAVYEPDL